MSTANVTAARSGTGFTVDVTICNLSSDLSVKDFIVLHAGVQVANSNYTKTTPTLITYSGVTLTTSTTIQVQRATPVAMVSPITGFPSKITSVLWNSEFDRVNRRAEEYALNGIGPTALLALTNLRVTVPAVSDLRLYSGFTQVETLGYYTVGDGGGARYYVDTSDSTSPDNGGSVIVGTVGRRWKMVDRSRVSVLCFGVKMDGTTDNYTTLQAAINSGDRLSIPAGTCRVVNELTLVSNLDILGTGRNSIIQCNRSASASQEVFIFQGEGLTNIKFAGVHFQVGPAFTAMAIWCVSMRVRQSTYITVENCYCSGPRLFYSDCASNTNYSQCDSTKRSYKIRVLNNTCVGTADSGTGFPSDAAILLRWTEDAVVSGNLCTNYYSGVQWWGGNSDQNYDGAITNERKCKNITISNNTTKVTSAGIWGSMGQRVTVVGNTVEDAYDVGIDFEGSLECAAVGNSVFNGHNGCYTTFFLNRGIEFVGNVARVNNASYPLFRMYNSSLDNSGNRDINVIGNSFVGENVITTVDDDYGPCHQLNFVNNTLNNCRIKFSAANQANVRVVNNSMVFNVAAGTDINAIEVGSTAYGRAVISGNTIHSSVAQSSGSVGIHVHQNDQFNTTYTLVENNQITSFVNDLYIETNVPSGASVTAYFMIRNNRLGAGVLNRYEPNGHQNCRLIDNRNMDGTPYPSAVPTGNSWQVGQKIDLHPVTSGGYIGSVCVTAGSPGTWRGYGAIA